MRNMYKMATDLRTVVREPHKSTMALFGFLAIITYGSCVGAALQQALQLREARQHIPRPPPPESVSISSLPLPPVLPNNSTDGCTLSMNPRGTGCTAVASGLQVGNFLSDGHHIVATIAFTNPRNDSALTSIYTGNQVIVVKADGSTFPNGDSWKCITCGARDYSDTAVSKDYAYPQAFRDGTRVLAGAHIIDCGGRELIDDECAPEQLSIYSVRLENKADGSGPGAAIRELRLHPDQVHLGFNIFSYAGGQLGQNTYTARLTFNPSPTTGALQAPRYDLTHVNQLSNPGLPPPIYVDGKSLHINHSSITVGELRGFTGSGREVTYIGYPFESCNIDVMAADLKTGRVRRLTKHPGYVDPIEFSPDDESFVIMDTRGSSRTDFMDGMRGIPPIVDLVSTTACASVRNNGPRRFFQPWLLDRCGDRGDYYGQELNNASSGVLGSGDFDDPNWNGMADPWFSPDGTKIVYWQAQTVSPACGGEDQGPCFNSTEPGGRTERIMIAHLTSRKPLPRRKIEELPDIISWATPYIPGATSTASSISPVLPAGNYTLKGEYCGHADVQIILKNDLSGVKTIKTQFANFSDDGIHFLRGYQDITQNVEGFTLNKLDWYTKLVRAGPETSTQVSSEGGFHMSIDVMSNLFKANGTLVTTVGDEVYEQPRDGQ